MKKKCENCTRSKHRTEDEKKNLKRRLKIISGQINGIGQMIDDNRYCDDVLLQVASATDMQEKGFDVEIIPANKDGLVSIEDLRKMLRNDTILVSVCHVDSEIGLVQPIKEIGNLLKEYPNCFFHTDASQAIGKVPLSYDNVDLVAIAPHKFYGLNGTGILIKKKEVSLKPQISGGKSTTVYRSGTPCLADIASCDIALDITLKEQEKRYKYIKELSDKVKANLQEYKDVYINNTHNSIPHTINFSIKKVRAMDIQNALEKCDIYVSTKTSCCPVNTPSKLVYALTKDKSLSTSFIRLSISHLTTKEEIEEFLKAFDNIYKEYQNNGKI